MVEGAITPSLHFLVDILSGLQRTSTCEQLIAAIAQPGDLCRGGVG